MNYMRPCTHSNDSNSFQLNACFICATWPILYRDRRRHTVDGCCGPLTAVVASLPPHLSSASPPWCTGKPTKNWETVTHYVIGCYAIRGKFGFSPGSALRDSYTLRMLRDTGKGWFKTRLGHSLLRLTLAQSYVRPRSSFIRPRSRGRCLTVAMKFAPLLATVARREP